MKKHTEARLEDAIIDHLCESGGFVFVDYRDGEAKGRYDKARALDPVLVLDFIQKTQEKIWNSLHSIHGEETGKIVLDHLCHGERLQRRKIARRFLGNRRRPRRTG